jgi:hypothetical protein
VAPAITTPPQDQNVNQTSNAVFSVVATGTPAPVYQWRKNGTPIAGATDSSYTVANPQPASAGSYSVVVTNLAGTATSGDAMLTVNVPPTITGQPQSVSAAVGSNVTFTVTATGTSPLSYQWKLNGTNLAYGTASAYACPNIQTNDAGSYSVVVSNIAGVLASDDALLAVIAPNPPQIDAATLLSGQGLELQMSGGPGQFAIEVSPELLSWTQLTTLTATGAVFQFIDADTNQVSRFYRIRTSP